MKHQKLFVMAVTIMAGFSIFYTPISAESYRLNKYDTDFTKSFTYTSSTHGFTDYYRAGVVYNGNAENKKSVAVNDWAYCSSKFYSLDGSTPYETYNSGHPGSDGYVWSGKNYGSTKLAKKLEFYSDWRHDGINNIQDIYRQYFY